MIVTVDGGLDKNLRQTKTINYAIDYFNEQDLDVYFVGTNARGQSVFSQVEKGMSNFRVEQSDFFSQWMGGKMQIELEKPAVINFKAKHVQK